ncbi:MAG: hypothetical protein S4CHLAM37_09140 [Chlamydiia bacterium]|nr:hypothetical protein [Chlamydiia bacterium]
MGSISNRASLFFQVPFEYHDESALRGENFFSPISFDIYCEDDLLAYTRGETNSTDEVDGASDFENGSTTTLQLPRDSKRFELVLNYSINDDHPDFERCYTLTKTNLIGKRIIIVRKPDRELSIRVSSTPYVSIRECVRRILNAVIEHRTNRS